MGGGGGNWRPADTTDKRKGRVFWFRGFGGVRRMQVLFGLGFSGAQGCERFLR